jgi:hypothetical protein
MTTAEKLIAAAPKLLALLIESQESIGGDWRDRRDAVIAELTETQRSSSEATDQMKKDQS